MNETELHELAAVYAVDALAPEERAQFEAHLSGCPDCQAEVAELQEAAAALSQGLESSPPAELRARVLSMVAAEAGPGSSSPRSVPGRVRSATASTRAERLRARETATSARPSGGRWLLAAAAAAVLVTGVWGASELLDPDDPATRVVQAQDAREYEADTAAGELTVIASADEGAAVLRIPADMGAPPQGQVYQAWYVGADGSARSAGLLTAESLEAGETLLEGTPAGAAAVGLTVEPAGGSAQPTSEPFAVVPLS